MNRETFLVETDGTTEAMSDTPKFEVIDRRKFKAEEEHEREKSTHQAEPAPESSHAPTERTEARFGWSAPRRV